MGDLRLYLGPKNYSSWSVRAWLAMRLTGAPFTERTFDLSADGVRDEIARHSPTRLVPALADGEITVWDSLAICEYLAEKFPDAGLWPAAPEARAAARSVAAEMHSGFGALRRSMPMNVRRSSPGKGREPGVRDDIDRITAIWRWCRGRWASGGDYLFGAWTVADCMYAPVVSRFRTYAVELDRLCQRYADAVWSRPEVREWRQAAAQEPITIPKYDL